jgi:hypothetical protein
MKTTRLLAVLLALPLLAFDCGGGEEDVDPFRSGFGFGCTVHVAGAVPAEDLWCVPAAYDYSAFPDPQLASTTWGFVVSGYRGVFPSTMLGVGAGGGFFLAGRPTVGTTYSWSGSTASTAFVSGGFDRYDGSGQLTHSNTTLGNGSYGVGSFSVRFSAIPPPNATDEQLLGVHGTFSATLKPLGGFSGDVTLTATF